MLKSKVTLTNLEEIFKALANEKRLEALSLLLAEGEMSLQSLSSELRIPLKTASRNLGILRRAGFVSARREDGRIVYEINTATDEEYIITLLVLVKDAMS